MLDTGARGVHNLPILINMIQNLYWFWTDSVIPDLITVILSRRDSIDSLSILNDSRHQVIDTCFHIRT